MWKWEDDDDEDLNDFNFQRLDLPIERYTCIESNFLNILGHEKLSKYFDMDDEDNDYDFERECIINMTMAVTSVLVDLDRVDDAVNLIDQCERIGQKKGWMHGKLYLMKASLLINRRKDLVQKFDAIMCLLNHAQTIFNELKMNEGIAEAFYLQGLLLTNLDRLQQHQISYGLHSKFLKHTQSEIFKDKDILEDLNDDNISN